MCHACGNLASNDLESPVENGSGGTGTGGDPGSGGSGATGGMIIPGCMHQEIMGKGTITSIDVATEEVAEHLTLGRAQTQRT